MGFAAPQMLLRSLRWEPWRVLAHVYALACCSHMSPLLQDDEYVVYSPDQVRLKYVVRFSMEGDQLKEFSPTVSTSAELLPPSTVQGEHCTPAEQSTLFSLSSGVLAHLLSR